LAVTRKRHWEFLILIIKGVMRKKMEKKRKGNGGPTKATGKEGKEAGGGDRGVTQRRRM